MKHPLQLTAVVFAIAHTAYGQSPAKPLVTGLKNPTAVAVDSEGRFFVTVRGDSGREDSGGVLRIDQRSVVPIASGLEGPWGIVACRQSLYVTDRYRVLRIDSAGKVTVFVPQDAFPDWPRRLNAIAIDADNGILYVNDTVVEAGGGRVHGISPTGEVTTVFR